MGEVAGFQLGVIGALFLSVASSVSIVICNKALMSNLGFPFGLRLYPYIFLHFIHLGIDIGSHICLSSTVVRGVVSLILGYLNNLVIGVAFFKYSCFHEMYYLFGDWENIISYISGSKEPQESRHALF